jgi:type II secretory pathway component PulF
MAVYTYNAVDGVSSATRGTIVADTPYQARCLLRERGLTVTGVSPAADDLRSRKRASRRQRLEVTALIRDTATLLAAGIPLLDTLKTLSEQQSRGLKSVVQQLADSVAAGESLADAMGRHGGFFDELCTSVVRVGENTGAMEQSLQRLAQFREKVHRLRSRVTTAMVYPAVVCVVGLAVGVFLMTYVVPNLLGALRQSGRELPAVTRVVQSASELLRNWWWALLAGAAGVAAAVKALLRTEAGKLARDRLVLRIPVLGDLVRKEITSRLAVVLAALLRGGLQFVDALKITRRTIPNRVFRRALDDYERAVTAGKDVAEPLRATGVFSPMVVQMLAVGQQSGQLEEMLEQLADAYDQQVSVATQRFTAVLEPLLIVLLAVGVGFIAFATILPILEISNVF